MCIGSDRAHGYVLAKNQLFRTLDDTNPVPELAKLEAEIMEEANRHRRRRDGLWRKVSLIGCKIMAANRLPASFFVSVAYDCWAYRRLGVRLDAASGAITNWLYRDPPRPVEKMAQAGRIPAHRTRNRAARAAYRGTGAGAQGGRRGDYPGRRCTPAATRCTRYLMNNPPPVDLHGAVLYHCGPVMLKQGDDVDRESRRPHHQHPRGALSGRTSSRITACARSSEKAGWARRRSRR